MSTVEYSPADMPGPPAELRGTPTPAAAAGDSDVIHLWAGTGYRRAAEKLTAAILTELAG